MLSAVPTLLFCHWFLTTLFLFPGAIAQTYSATYLPDTAPKTTEKGQTGTNQCGTGVNQTSSCQNAYSTYLAVLFGACWLLTEPMMQLIPSMIGKLLVGLEHCLVLTNRKGVSGLRLSQVPAH